MKYLITLLFLLSASVFAQDTSSNLIGGSWNNVNTGTHPNNCCTGGPAPLYDPATNTIHFSYGLTAVHQVIAINQALSGSGVQINGWNWGYDLRNLNGVAGGQSGTDTISVTSFMTNSAGQIIQQSDQYFNTQFDWTRFSGTEVLSSSLSLENSGSLGIQFVAKDGGFWAGYYGPQVRNVTLNANYTVDACSANPLSDTSCPGYAAAYLSQQCTINPLYDPSCPNYTTAQCTINALYSPVCPGYQVAYYNQQCSLNALYDINCPGYAAAYLEYQCSLDSLYSTTCAGYETAYFNQQCSLDSLYNSKCPGYETAYFNQQCSLSGLYSNQCPNYAEEYAKKNILNIGSTTPSTTTNSTIVVLAQSSDPVEQAVPIVADPVVNSAITTKSTTTTNQTNPAAAVKLTAPVTTTVTTTTATTEEKKSNSQTETAQSTGSENKTTDKPKTARQELQAKREAAAKAKAVEEGKNLAENMGKAVDMEQQKLVQNVVLQAMSFVPGFDAYTNVRLDDKPFYRTEQIYKGQVNVDNRNLSRGMIGPSENLHNEMVNSQYQLGN